MKKLLYLLMVGLLVVACDDDDDYEGTPPYYQPFELQGNVYYRELETSENGEKLFNVFEFKSDKEVEYLQRRGSADGEPSTTPENYTYIFDFPGINMSSETGQLMGATFNITNPDSLQVIAKGGWFIKLK